MSFLRLVAAGRIHAAFVSRALPGMKHHRPACAGNAAGLEKAMRENHERFPDGELEVKRVLEDGEMVVVHSCLRPEKGSSGFSAVHLFRFEGERIAEMWEILQAVPEGSPNLNGMF